MPTIRSHRLPYRLLLVAAMLCTATLQGCLTAALWSDELVPAGVPDFDFHLLDEAVAQFEGEVTVAVATPGAEPEVRFVGRGGQFRSVVLRPDRHREAVKSVAAMRQLIRDHGGNLEAARVLLHRDWLIGEDVAEWAELELLLRPHVGEFAAVVADEAVPDQVRRQLRSAVQPNFAFGAGAVSALTLAEQCERRLDCVDFADLLGTTMPVTIESAVFADEHGRVSAIDREPAPLDSGFWGADDEVVLPESEQLRRDLARLGGLTMWVAVQCRGERHFLRFSAADLWLVYASERRGELLVHRSLWRPVSTDLHPDDLLADEPWMQPSRSANRVLAVLPAMLVRSDLAYCRELDANRGLGVFEKVLLTPFTLAVDILFQQLWRLIVPWRQYDEDHGVGGGR